MVDGSFGDGTADAVSEYQDLRGRKVDGSCGRITWIDIQTQIQNVYSISNKLVVTHLH